MYTHVSPILQCIGPCYFIRSFRSIPSVESYPSILFSNQNVQNPSLLHDNVNITFVHNHKHLGLTLNKHGKWKVQITNITKSASKVLGIMRSLKFKLCRESLNQIYILFLRPIQEYASVVWDNCTVAEKGCTYCNRNN